MRNQVLVRDQRSAYLTHFLQFLDSPASAKSRMRRLAPKWKTVLVTTSRPQRMPLSRSGPVCCAQRAALLPPVPVPPAHACSGRKHIWVPLRYQSVHRFAFFPLPRRPTSGCGNSEPETLSVTANRQAGTTVGLGIVRAWHPCWRQRNRRLGARQIDHVVNGISAGPAADPEIP